MYFVFTMIGAMTSLQCGIIEMVYSSSRYEIRVSIESGAIQKILQFMAISPIGKQRSHPWNVSTNEGAVTRKYDNSWPSNQGFSNFLFEHKVFITFQLVNFILNQIGRLRLYSNQETSQLLHTISWRFYFKISPLVHPAPNIDLYLKLIIVLMFSINIIIWHCVTQ